MAQAARTVDTPPELQKPKAEQTLTRVNFQTPEQRLIDQIAVPQDTNEEAAVAAHLSKMDLAGVLIIADAGLYRKSQLPPDHPNAPRLATQEHPQSQSTDPTVGPSQRLKDGSAFLEDRLTCCNVTRYFVDGVTV